MKEVRWARSVECMGGIRNAYNILTRRYEGKG
jgi:hypothetical protein